LSIGETIQASISDLSTGEDVLAITSTNRILEIDRLSGQVIQRGAAIDGSLFSASTTAGFDFNPTADRLRLAKSQQMITFATNRSLSHRSTATQ
jgi:hypothetical protein